MRTDDNGPRQEAEWRGSVTMLTAGVPEDGSAKDQAELAFF